jgi:hypothetical protein
VSAAGVARAYAPWLDALIVDERAPGADTAVAAEGVEAIVADTMMTGRAAETALARRVLEALG